MAPNATLETLSFNPIPGRLFSTFGRQGGLLARVRKTAIKAGYFIQVNWYNTSFDPTKNFNISHMMIKMMM